MPRVVRTFPKPLFRERANRGFRTNVPNRHLYVRTFPGPFRERANKGFRTFPAGTCSYVPETPCRSRNPFSGTYEQVFARSRNPAFRERANRGFRTFPTGTCSYVPETPFGERTNRGFRSFPTGTCSYVPETPPLSGTYEQRFSHERSQAPVHTFPKLPVVPETPFRERTNRCSYVPKTLFSGTCEQRFSYVPDKHLFVRS